MLTVVSENESPLDAKAWVMAESPREWGAMRKAARVMRQSFNALPEVGGYSTLRVAHAEGPRGLRWAGRMPIESKDQSSNLLAACAAVEKVWRPGNRKDPSGEQMAAVLAAVRAACRAFDRMRLSSQENLSYCYQSEVQRTKLECCKGMLHVLNSCKDLDMAKQGVEEMILHASEATEIASN